MTTVYNVHIGLSAWPATTAVTAGQRKSNGGNAYQVITAGTTAGAGGPTGTGSSISDGTAVWKYLSAIDYSSLTAVNSAVAALTAAFSTTVRFEFWNDGIITGSGTWGGTGVMTQPLQIPSGLGASNTNRLQFACAAGESIFDNGNRAVWFDSSAGVTFQNTNLGSFSYFAYCRSDYVDWDGFQWDMGDPGAGSIFYGALRVDNTSTNYSYRRNLVRHYTYNAGSHLQSDNSSIITLNDNVFIDLSAGTGGAVVVMANGVNGGNVYQNTVFTPNTTGNQGIVNVFGSFTAKSNLIIGPSDPLATGFNTVTSEKNVVSAASYSGSVSDTLSTFNAVASSVWKNVASDLNLKSGSVAIGAGVTGGPANDAFNLPFGSPPSAGAIEYVAPTSGRLLVRQNMTGGMNQEFTGGMGA